MKTLYIYTSLKLLVMYMGFKWWLIANVGLRNMIYGSCSKIWLWLVNHNNIYLFFYIVFIVIIQIRLLTVLVLKEYKSVNTMLIDMIFWWLTTFALEGFFSSSSFKALCSPICFIRTENYGCSASTYHVLSS
jgi:hypothetical protein